MYHTSHVGLQFCDLWENDAKANQKLMEDSKTGATGLRNEGGKSVTVLLQVS